MPAVEARTRYGWIREAVAGGGDASRPQRPVTWTDRLDRVLTHRVWGTLVFLAVMFLVFQSIFTWAEPLMELIDAGKDWLADGASSGAAAARAAPQPARRRRHRRASAACSSSCRRS